MVIIYVILILAGMLFLRQYYLKLLRQKEQAIQELSSRLTQQQQKSFHDKNELNAILSSMVEGVIVIGRDEKILYVSPNVSAMFELRSKDVALKAFWEVIPHQQINDCIKEALSVGQAVNKEIALIGAQDIFFNMQISPVLQDGQLTSVVGVFHDITALKSLVKLRSEFVANVSHELKTPLTSIKGFVETLQEQGGVEDADNARRFLEIIHKQTKRLENLVNDLLTLSAIESKEDKMECVPTDIGPFIQSMLMMYKQAIEKSGHNIKVEIPVGLSKINADRNRLEQVFINLLDNAVKFTPTAGNITISAKAEQAFVRINIADTGIGIAPEHLSRVFERFYRADKARSSALGGTGLGLSIVKHIVHAHQGKVEVQSTLGQGTTFSVFFPIYR